MRIEETTYYKFKKLNLHTRKLGREIMRLLKPVLMPVIEWLNPYAEKYMKLRSLRIILVIIGLNIGLSSMIFALNHPKLTQTEVFLHIPKSFIWKLK